MKSDSSLQLVDSMALVLVSIAPDSIRDALYLGLIEMTVGLIIWGGAQVRQPFIVRYNSDYQCVQAWHGRRSIQAYSWPASQWMRVIPQFMSLKSHFDSLSLIKTAEQSCTFIAWRQKQLMINIFCRKSASDWEEQIHERSSSIKADTSFSRCYTQLYDWGLSADRTA